jgi:hypothetical protein
VDAPAPAFLPVARRFIFYGCEQAFGSEGALRSLTICCRSIAQEDKSRVIDQEKAIREVEERSRYVTPSVRPRFLSFAPPVRAPSPPSDDEELPPIDIEQFYQ